MSVHLLEQRVECGGPLLHGHVRQSRGQVSISDALRRRKRKNSVTAKAHIDDSTLGGDSTVRRSAPLDVTWHLLKSVEQVYKMAKKAAICCRILMKDNTQLP